MKKFALNTILTCAAALVMATPQQTEAAAIIFDDFNVNEGHFNQNINFSGTTVGEDASSTADRVTTDGPKEGPGHQKLVLVHDGTTTAFRLRHVSGSGSPANNVSFTTTSGTDGKIGFYLKTTESGWQTSINLDGAGGSGGEMDGGNFQDIIGDGEWHLYEWDLDSTTDWGAVTGIGGGHAGMLLDGSHTIDSIYIRDNDGTPGPTATIYLDFVALNPAGSVADLLSEPCLSTPGVLVSGPIHTNSNQVTVVGVLGTASKITVYQDTGSGMLPIGTKTTGIVAGTNFVTVSGLVKSATVAATQTVSSQESCVPTIGVGVGSGANPSVRVALTIRETSSTGPVGEAGVTSSGNLHFLGASTVQGGSPVDANIIYPSNDWQTVTLQAGVDHSIQWNPSVGNPDYIPTPWGILESINFAINDDTGPFDIYIDNIQNGTNVFQTFEGAVAGTVDYALRAPSFSGTTSGNLLPIPDLGVVTNNVADTGSKSYHMQFQFNGTNVAKWLRLSTTGQGLSTAYPINPQVDLSQPISFRILLLPYGAPAPVAPTAPILSASKVSGNAVLSWSGAHKLQAATDVTGVYTNVPALSTNAFNPYPSPYTNSFAEPHKFFRLVD